MNKYNYIYYHFHGALENLFSLLKVNSNLSFPLNQIKTKNKNSENQKRENSETQKRGASWGIGKYSQK